MPTSTMLTILITVMITVTGFFYKNGRTNKKYWRLYQASLGITAFLVAIVLIIWGCTVSHNSAEKSDETIEDGKSENTEGNNEKQQSQNASEVITDNQTASGDDLVQDGKGVSLEESNTLFDGMEYKYYKSSDGENFSVGSGTYDSGFILNYDGDIPSAFVLFDLKGNYSRVLFDVGRVNETEYGDVVMTIYIDDHDPEEYNLSASAASRHFEVDLNNAGNLKIEIKPARQHSFFSYDTFTYGFFDMFFEY